MYIYVDFPAGIESFELYEMVKEYKLNVLDLHNKIYMYGEVPSSFMPNVIAICSKFSYISITIKNPAR